jgi:hypothetical protein
MSYRLIEQKAIDFAKNHYSSKGFIIKEEAHKGYDLSIIKTAKKFLLK